MNKTDKTEEGRVLNDEKSLLLDHNYDGIQELDHVLPRWWLWLFYSTIVFAAWYAGYYMSGNGPTPQQELAVAMQEIAALKPVVTPTEKAGENESLLAALKDPTKLKMGSEVYAGKCFACHGDKGQGVVGPNLTDDYWIHGKGTLKDVVEVVAAGIPEKGMPPWGTVLTSDELRNVVAFVHSLHGSNPAGAKTAQGDKQDFKD